MRLAYSLIQRLSQSAALPIVAGSLAGLLYLVLAWFVLPPAALWSPDEGAKLLQLKSLYLYQGRLNIGAVYTGQGLDPDFEYALINPQRDLLSIQNDQLVFQRLPVFTLLSLPFYRLLGLSGLYLFPALAGGVIVGLTLALSTPTEPRWLLGGLIALGSPVIIYATLFWEHTLSTALVLVALWLALPVSAKARLSARWAVIGALLGAAAYLRLEVLLLAAALLAAVFWLNPAARPGTVLAALSLFLVLLPYPILHRGLFAGQALPANAQYLFYPLSYLKRAGINAIQDLLIGPYTDESIRPGWIGAIWTGASVLVLLTSLLPRPPRWLRGLSWVGLLVSALAAAYFLFTPTAYRSAHGLLFTTPWALIGLVGLVHDWSQRSLPQRIILLTTLLGVSAYTIAILGLRAGPPHGGLEWGARFAMPFYPLLALATVWMFKTRPRWQAGLLLCLVLLGVAFQVRGLWTIRHDKQINAALNQALVNAPEINIFSDLWWLPLNASPIYPQKAIFLSKQPDQLAQLAALADSQQFHSFVLVTLDPGLPNRIAEYLPHTSLTIVDTQQIENLLCFRLMLTPK